MDFVSAARCSIHKTYFCTGETSPGPGDAAVVPDTGDSVGVENEKEDRPGVKETAVKTDVETAVETAVEKTVETEVETEVLDQDVLAETVTVESQKEGAAEGEPDLNMLLGHRF